MVKFKLVRKKNVKAGIMTNNAKRVQKDNKCKILRFCDLDITPFNKTSHIR